MYKTVMLVILLIFDLNIITSFGHVEDSEISIRMPNVISLKPDMLICTGVTLEPEEAYIVKYTPHANRSTAHHMMVYGCKAPANYNRSWECNNSDRPYTDHSVCADGEERQILFAWALDAPAKALPEGVGFRIAGSTDIKHLIIQIHYTRKFSDRETDNSGVSLSITHQRPPQQMNFYVLGSIEGVAPQRQEVHIDIACLFDRDYPIYPIGFRTHSHNLGVVTSGYRIRDGKWTEIGRMSPQLPQTFYNTSNPGMDIRKDDILASRCTMNSMTRKDYTKMGPRNRDEMCNFYIMYSTYNQDNLKTEYCFPKSTDFTWEEALREYLPPPSDVSLLDGIHNARYVKEKFNMT